MAISKEFGSTVTLTVTVKNCGSLSRTFPVGFSLKRPDGVWIDFTEQYITLGAGSTGTKTFYTTPLQMEGRWEVVTAVWYEKRADGKLYGLPESPNNPLSGFVRDYVDIVAVAETICATITNVNLA